MIEHRTLGRTQLSVSPLALGTVELGMDYGIPAPGDYGRPPAEAAIRLVHAALERGINLIDTARAYGESEAVLARALHDRRDRAVLATKVTVQEGSLTFRGDRLRQAMLDGLETSLRTLQTDYVDIWQIHNVDGDLLAQSELVAEVFDLARSSGKVRWIGGSFYGAELPLAALEKDIFDVLQVTYSVLDQRLSDEVFPKAQSQNVGIMTRSVLLQGALTERAEHLPDSVEIIKDRSREFRRLVAESGIDLTPAQAAIAFALTEPRIDSVLVGMRAEAELSENLKALETSLPDDLLAELCRLRLDDPELLNPGTWYNS